MVGTPRSPRRSKRFRDPDDENEEENQEEEQQQDVLETPPSTRTTRSRSNSTSSKTKKTTPSSSAKKKKKNDDAPHQDSDETVDIETLPTTATRQTRSRSNSTSSKTKKSPSSKKTTKKQEATGDDDSDNEADHDVKNDATPTKQAEEKATPKDDEEETDAVKETPTSTTTRRKKKDDASSTPKARQTGSAVTPKQAVAGATTLAEAKAIALQNKSKLSRRTRAMLLRDAEDDDDNEAAKAQREADLRKRLLSPSSPSKKKKKKKKKQKKNPQKKRRRLSVSSRDGDLEAKLPPPGPTMDVQVHRLRHLQYVPSAVLSMTTCTSTDGNLALAREDGSYELYNVNVDPPLEGEAKHQGPPQSPHLHPLARIAGASLMAAHSMCWVTTSTASNERQQVCVAGGPDGTLWMVNFAKSQLQNRFSSGGGGVFDLVTCGGGCDMPIVASACQDGSVRLWQVRGNRSNIIMDSTPIATIPSTGAAVLSLAWGLAPCAATKSGYFETVLFAGVADGTIRKYDLRLSCSSNNDAQFWKVENVSSVLRMTTESRGRQTTTKVWTMQILRDKGGDITLVTGNSLGQVQFWNGQAGTLDQSISQTEHKADVLRIAVSTNQKMVYASGVDSRVICLERNGDGAATTWKWTNTQRPHTHDVKAMAIVTPSMNGTANKNDDDHVSSMETLVTCGIDTKLCSYLVHDFAKRRPQIWFPWPVISPISTAPKVDLLSMQRDDRVDLYRLDDIDDTTTTDSQTKQQKIAKDSSTPIGTIRIQTMSNIVASSLCHDGQYLAICNATALLIFRLNLQVEAGEGVDDGLFIEPEQIEIPKSIANLCATAILFDENNKLYVADTDWKIHIVDLGQGDAIPEPTVLSIAKGTKSSKTSFSFPIDAIDVSKGGEYVAALRRDRKDGIHVFKRKNDDQKSYAPYWTIPSLAGARPAAMTLMEGEQQLAVATPNSKIYVFDLAKQKLTSWSEKNGFPIQKWPSDLTHSKDFPVRLTTNPQNSKQIIMSCFGSFCVINTEGGMPSQCRIVPEIHVRRKKPRTTDDDNDEEESGDKKSDDPGLPLLSRQSFGRNKPNKKLFHRANNHEDDPMIRNCTLCLNYNSMLYFDFLGPGKMVVVEQPWLQVISSFPAPLQRRVYGGN